MISLFGGAAQCILPSGWVDASRFRQVPDHQEVYLDTVSSSSVIIEILESQEKGIRFCFDDLAAADSAVSSIVHKQETLPTIFWFIPNVPVTKQYIEGVQEKGDCTKTVSPVFVAMTLLRIPEADILVTTHNVSPKMSISLPVSGTSVSEWINVSVKRSDLSSLSVSLQLMTAELFQDLQVMETRISRHSFPNKTGEEYNVCFKEPSANISDKQFSRIEELDRAQANIQRIRNSL